MHTSSSSSSGNNNWINITGTRFQPPPTRHHCTFQLCNALHRNRWMEVSFYFCPFVVYEHVFLLLLVAFFPFRFRFGWFFSSVSLHSLVPFIGSNKIVNFLLFACTLSDIIFRAFRINAVIEHQSDSHKITTFNLQRVFKQEKKSGSSGYLNSDQIFFPFNFSSALSALSLWLNVFSVSLSWRGLAWWLHLFGYCKSCRFASWWLLLI